MDVRYREAMAIEAAKVPGDAFTYDDILAMPADGRRYELFDGALLVTAAPRRLHQRCVHRLDVLLGAAASRSGYEVLPGPIDLRLSENRILEPDLIVVRTGPGNERIIDEVPRLVVEVASPSTRAIDRDLKRRAYEERGVTSYWLVDPDEPSLTVLELDSGLYAERARVVGTTSYEAQLPFAITITPADLIS